MPPRRRSRSSSITSPAAPHHPTPEWIKKISDLHLFDKGWNDLRETIFANQKKFGVIPANTQLTPWPDSLPNGIRSMLIIYISGDNGTSAEGSTVGTPFDLAAIQAVNIPVKEQLKFYDVWGSDLTTLHMSVAWSWAFDTPFKWTKEVASFFGGTRQGMVMSWPGHIRSPHHGHYALSKGEVYQPQSDI